MSNNKISKTLIKIKLIRKTLLDKLLIYVTRILKNDKL